MFSSFIGVMVKATTKSFISSLFQVKVIYVNSLLRYDVSLISVYYGVSLIEYIFVLFAIYANLSMLQTKNATKYNIKIYLVLNSKQLLDELDFSAQNIGFRQKYWAWFFFQ